MIRACASRSSAALHRRETDTSIAPGTGIFSEPVEGTPASTGDPFWGQSRGSPEFNCGPGLWPLAALRGRTYVLPDDMKYLARPVLAHRLILQETEQLRGQTSEQVLDEILAQTPLPS